MKELYTAPALELLCLAPVEELANSEVEMDEMLGGSGDPASYNAKTDIEIPLD